MYIGCKNTLKIGKCHMKKKAIYWAAPIVELVLLEFGK